MGTRPIAAPQHGGPSATTDTVDCTVIVVTYNSARHIESFLDSVPAAAGPRSWRVVVVDNDSSDGTVDVVRWRPDVDCVALGTNHGYSAGINAGRASAGPCRSILVANPDVRLAPGSIDRLFAAVADGGYGAAVPMLRDSTGTITRSLRREPTVGRQIGEALFGDRFAARPPWLSEIVREPDAYASGRTVEWAAGAVVMVSAECDEVVGAWDESYFLFSEEVDYAERIRRSGYTIAYVPEAEAVHDEGGSGRSEALIGLVVVNRLRYYGRRHGRAASACYAAGLLLQLVVRAADPAHRRAAAVLVRAAVPAVLWNRVPSSSALRGQSPSRPPITSD